MVFSSQLREFPQMIIALDKYSGYMLTSEPNHMMSSSVAMEILSITKPSFSSFPLIYRLIEERRKHTCMITLSTVHDQKRTPLAQFI